MSDTLSIYDGPIITSEFTEKYKGIAPPWGFNGMGEIVYMRTYARDIESLGRKEQWHETIARCINGAQKIGANYTKEEAERLFDYIFNLKGIFAGRCLWQLGTPLVEKMSGVSLVNCWMTSISKIEDFKFLMDHLMVGGGVGFTIERAVVHDFPKVREVPFIRHEKTNDADFIVPDSRQGWSSLIGKVLTSYFETGESFTYSTVLIRGFGAPLKTFGGTASGPEILVEGINDICNILNQRIGKKIRSVDALDIANIIGKIVVAGSARRSAQIAIGDPDDFLFLRAKNWGRGDIPGWRANSNNSIYADAFDEIIEEFWKGYDGSGEPYGLINRALIRKNGRLGEKVNDNKVIGTNPCVTADTWVLTDLGPRLVSDLLDNDFTALVDGKPFQSTAFWNTGKKQILKVITSTGHSVRLTANHKILTKDHGWVEAGNLSNGDVIILHDHTGASWDGEGTDDDGYILGHLIGDGTFYPNGTPAVAVWKNDDGFEYPKQKLTQIMQSLPHRSDYKGWYSTGDGNQLRSSNVGLRELAKKYSIVRGNKTVTPEVEMASSSFCIGFIRGLFDTDGCVEGDSYSGGVSIRLSQSNYEMLEGVQRMLSRLGILSTIYSGHKAGYKELPGGNYFVKDNYRLCISGKNAEKFVQIIGFYNQSKLNKWNTKKSLMTRSFYEKGNMTTVVDVVEDGVEDVYDCTVFNVHAFDANGIYVHNCGEIGLEDGEPCNLAEVFLPNVSSKEELIDISKLLYKTQKAITTLAYPYKKSQDVIQRNRRLGQGITGWLQSTDEQLSWIDDAYLSLKEYDKEWSSILEINPSIKLTTVKPSGTLSLLAGVTPGIHPAYAKYYIRRVRMGSNDPLVNFCRSKGYDVQFDVGIDGKENHTICVVSFPCVTPDHATLAENLSAIDQLEWVVKAQSTWADNNVSVTVYYRKEELPEIQEWMAKNYKNKVKSVSFLLHSEHGFNLAPYEKISEEEYKKMKNKIKNDSIFVDTINNLSIDSLECEGGACPIK